MEMQNQGREPVMATGEVLGRSKRTVHGSFCFSRWFLRASCEAVGVGSEG